MPGARTSLRTVAGIACLLAHACPRSVSGAEGLCKVVHLSKPEVCMALLHLPPRFHQQHYVQHETPA